ncbi:MAG: AAA family ATPase [Solirubrobacterales bacterium]
MEAAMIKKLQLLRNIGQFDSVDSGAEVPLGRLSVVYAENGRGKTTIAAIMRSLASDDPIPIAERQRLSAAFDPHIVLESSDGPPLIVFENNAWSRNLPDVLIFDDVFINENVYSGLVVEPGHRQNLHELILGARGVALAKDHARLVDKIETHNAALRNKRAPISENLLGGFTIDQFCDLKPIDDIDRAVETAQRALDASEDQNAVRTTPPFGSFDLPQIDLPSIEAVLALDLSALDADAAARVEAHFATLGADAEAWVAEGMTRLNDPGTQHDADECPFCAQSLGHSPVIAQYREYFSDAYSAHTAHIAEFTAELEDSLGGDAIPKFERSVREAVERREIWSRYCDVPRVEVDTERVAGTLQAARETVLTALRHKQGSPLERTALSDEIRSAVNAYDVERQAVETASAGLTGVNAAVEAVKENAADADTAALRTNLTRLRAVQSRHTAETSALCDDYIAERTAKADTEADRDRVRNELNEFRRKTFPGFEAAINRYLERFNAGFRLDSVAAADTRSGATCTYNVVINDTPVEVAGREQAPGEPSFRNTLSSGDRNSLALAFFFASLDADPNLQDKIVVIDDPITSLDDHRSLTTVQEIRRLVDRAKQVIVLSHSKTLLCRTWESTGQVDRAAIQVSRTGAGSTISSWDVDADSVTEHDRNHALLRNYVANPEATDPHEVASAIRPLLEGFMRVAHPEHFPPSTLLGPFINKCNDRLSSAGEILAQDDANELGNLVEYANRFHHDTNPAWESDVVNDGELNGFVNRALEFTKR